MDESRQKLSVYIKITDTSEFGTVSSCSVSREDIGIYTNINNQFEEVMDTVVGVLNVYGYNQELIKQFMLEYAEDL